MTWCASHLYFRYQPRTVDILTAHPELSRGLYYISGLTNFDWCDPSFRHELPDGGLLVVRELGGEHSSYSDTFGTDLLDWGPFDSPDQPSPKISLGTAFAGHLDAEDLVDAEDLDVCPPDGLLGLARSVSGKTRSAAAYYFHATWGGQTECEFAWICADEEQAVTFLDNENVAVRLEDGRLERRNGRVLDHVLTILGLQLPTPFFAPHHRAFPWHRYKV